MITELLLEDAGSSLPRVISKEQLDDNIRLKFLVQSSSVLSYCERLKILNIDIKASNFLIDINKNLRIISYNLDLFQTGTKSYNIIYKGSEINHYLTEGYCSPESYLYFLKNKDALISTSETFDLHKSATYSWGILALFIFGGINAKQINKLDSFKKSVKDHENVLKYVENVKISNPELCTKIKYLLYCCLNYFSEKRIKMKEVNKILVNLENLKIDKMKEVVEEMLLKKRNTKDEISKKIELLKGSKGKEGFDEIKQQILNLIDKKEKDYDLIQEKNVELINTNKVLIQEKSTLEGIIKDKNNEILSLKSQIDFLMKSGNANLNVNAGSRLKEISPINKSIDTKLPSQNYDDINNLLLNNINKILKEKNITKKIIDLKDLPNLLKELIPHDPNHSQVNCPICKKEEEFFDAKKCIYQNYVEETRFSTWGIFCSKEKYWNLCEIGLTKNEISALTLIVSISPCLEFIDFGHFNKGFNPDFNESSKEELVNCLNSNNSLKGICLCINN